jgi:hypothetical protein
MPKRKRSTASTLEEELGKNKAALFRALKAAKGFERQRQSKRIHDGKSGQEKIERLQREVAVLKSLDLQQTAHAHLCSSLLRIKPISESPDLPEYILNGVPKPDLPDEEKAALHNVTSGLYNNATVKEVIDKAIKSICSILGVPVPEKKGRGKKSEESKEESKEDKKDHPEKPTSSRLEKPKHVENDSMELEYEQESSLEDSDGDLDEEALSRYAHMLGSSSDSEDGSEQDWEEWGGIDDDEEEEENTRLSDDEEDLPRASLELQTDISLPLSRSQSLSPSLLISPPPPPTGRVSKEKRTTSKAKSGSIKDSTFLPSLMSGYISGSESASDVDVAPPTRKNRLGQKQRQAIWEKKYGSKAKHISRPTTKSGRDAGWDMRKGAVEGGGQKGGGPWKQGIQSPFARPQSGSGTQAHTSNRVEKKEPEGPLHPSWEASKKAKESAKAAAFQGKKIVFD